MKALSIFSSIMLLISLVIAQEGSTATVTTSTTGSYSCDPSTCTISNNCLCASKTAPGGLSPRDVPQFVTITFDDSVQEALYQTALKMVSSTNNPNGCPGHGTWFVSMEYTDFSLVQKWYAAGNEVADHTFSHVGNPSAQEISACRNMLNTYAGIPKSQIQGFRAPYLNYTKDTLSILHEQGFLYDSTTSAVTDDIYFPYTLDNGLANDCWTGICGKDQTSLPGLWEIPMYSVLDPTNIAQLMDVYLAGTVADVKNWSETTFDQHYNGNRAPFGIYVHPTHLTKYPGLADPTDIFNGVLEFIKEIAAKPDVWLVTNQQLLQWMKNPVKSSELGTQAYMQCNQPVISKEICNGLDDDHNGVVDDNLINSCNFGTTSMNTCFNCPSASPTLQNPTPATSAQNGTSGYRYSIPETCDTVWWDPIGNTCLCNSADCELKSIATIKPSTNNTTLNNQTIVNNHIPDGNDTSEATKANISIAQLFISTVVVSLIVSFNQLI